MRLSVRGLAFAGGLLWSGAILYVGLVSLVVPSYGSTFLQMMSSIYIGFHASRTLGDALVGMIEGLADGAIAGFLFGWFYNYPAGTGMESRAAQSTAAFHDNG